MRDVKSNESVLDVFLLGLKTWLAEMGWLSRSVLARFEIGRLEKELEQEYATLGRIAEQPRGRKEDKDLCLGQISFLKEEIETLKAELVQDREARMSRLRPDSDPPDKRDPDTKGDLP
ncbi:hypothetical protein Daes_3136 [Pseudodesulfovibrio aespoeensis Aspo-2]|uniref:Uncharacterized protein n=2 Tax=Desulfovibrionaceae TaxID=194924 RepID=E6VR44_PSEA9|nr:hypothetical protein Daes_3136 [Pseudodesulfovibrio aespoeensis Aspo-2]MCG2732273.1 hypothetical protein [Pseudodesulfovibrio aespoeensis]